MNQPLQNSSPLLLNQKSSALTFLGSLLAIVSFALLTAASSKLSFPFPGSPIPITLQSFMVLLAGWTLGSKRGALSQLTLIGLGLTGLPVFSAPLPGQIVLLGPTGGYILGFVLAAYAMGLLRERFALRNPLVRFSAIFLASLYIFLPGVIWLVSLTKISWTQGLAIGLYPFLLGDVVKCAMTCATSYALSKVMRVKI